MAMTTEAESDQGDTTGITVVVENFSEEMVEAVRADQSARGSQSSLAQLFTAMRDSLRPSDLPKTRLVVTGDLVRSVNDREDRTDKPFTIERGAGLVAAKTMPPNSDGIVDILVPAYWLLPVDGVPPSEEQDRYIQHVAAHEVVHASLFHNGDEPFDLHHREEFGYAMQNFLSMASEQAEEHLAEFLGSSVTGRKLTQSGDQVTSSIQAWLNTLEVELPAIPEDSPDYFQRGMLVTFEALHILWKTLAYLAAALRRNENTFDAVPTDIASLPGWVDFVDAWWPKYIGLLGQIPMTTEIDVPATDEVVRELALLLQTWADEIGFDFHDTPQGGYFRIKFWD